MGVEVLGNLSLVVMRGGNVQALNYQHGGTVQVKLRFQLGPQVLPLRIGE